MITIKDVLYDQLYLYNSRKKTLEPYYWIENNEPITLISTYPYLKSILEVEEKNKKSYKPIEGKKPKMFNESQVLKIKEYKKQGLSNVKISKIMKCSEKTIRNYLKSC